MSTYAANLGGTPSSGVSHSPAAPFKGWLLKFALAGTVLSEMPFLEHLEELRESRPAGADRAGNRDCRLRPLCLSTRHQPDSIGARSGY